MRGYLGSGWAVAIAAGPRSSSGDFHVRAERDPTDRRVFAQNRRGVSEAAIMPQSHRAGRHRCRDQRRLGFLLSQGRQSYVLRRGHRRLRLRDLWLSSRVCYSSPPSARCFSSSPGPIVAGAECCVVVMTDPQPRLPEVYRLVRFSTVGINDEAKRLARVSAEEGTLVWGLEQTAGFRVTRTPGPLRPAISTLRSSCDRVAPWTRRRSSVSSRGYPCSLVTL